ncbi:MAG: NUDIX domain-containing protein [Candidatus Moranbacteria bacterium]|nr:NUDIX domain-containing protein [Candidatus Moranbacteria bacterium]
MRKKISDLISKVDPFDQAETAHIKDALEWILSGAEIFKIKSPDVPPKHLVSYSVLVDSKEKKILLLNHQKALLLLPSGGHVNRGETPLDAAKRELSEELGIEPKPLLEKSGAPFFVSQITTVGLTAGHVDVDLWYVFEHDSGVPINDKSDEFVREFNGYKWFDFEEILSMPIENFDVNMHRFVRKLKTALN